MPAALRPAARANSRAQESASQAPPCIAPELTVTMVGIVGAGAPTSPRAGNEGSNSGRPSGLAPSKTVLVHGGSRYLGQLLVQDLLQFGWTVGYTYSSHQLSFEHEDLTGFQVDFASGKGLLECFDALGPIARVINCAGMDDAAACEADPAAAAALNVPSKLLDALDRHVQVHGYEPFLIQVSSDQVYDGSRKLSCEWNAGTPINALGRTKLAGEKEVAARWPRHAVLRPGPLFGPAPPCPQSCPAPWLQHLDAELAAQKQVTAASDEWCSPVFSDDFLRACRKTFGSQDALPNKVINVGGERLNRYEMAAAVAEVRGYDRALIQPTSGASKAAAFAVPADTSMSSMRCERDLLIKLCPFKVAVLQTFNAKPAKVAA